MMSESNSDDVIDFIPEEISDPDFMNYDPYKFLHLYYSNLLQNLRQNHKIVEKLDHFSALSVSDKLDSSSMPMALIEKILYLKNLEENVLEDRKESEMLKKEPFSEESFNVNEEIDVFSPQIIADDKPSEEDFDYDKEKVMTDKPESSKVSEVFAKKSFEFDEEMKFPQNIEIPDEALSKKAFNNEKEEINKMISLENLCKDTLSSNEDVDKKIAERNENNDDNKKDKLPTLYFNINKVRRIPNNSFSYDFKDLSDESSEESSSEESYSEGSSSEESYSEGSSSEGSSSEESSSEESSFEESSSEDSSYESSSENSSKKTCFNETCFEKEANEEKFKSTVDSGKEYKSKHKTVLNLLDELIIGSSKHLTDDPNKPKVVDLQENESLTLVGEVMTFIENRIVIVKSKGSQTLDLDSILFLKDKEMLGKISDVFGPVIDPMYTITLDAETVERIGKVETGVDVFCASNRSDLTQNVFKNNLAKAKGSDASWVGDVEPPITLVDYSDDEEEKAAKRKVKLSNGVKFNQGKRKMESVTRNVSQKFTSSCSPSFPSYAAASNPYNMFNMYNQGHRTMTPRNMGPRNMGPGNMGPRNMGPRNMGPGNMGHGNMGPRIMGPRNMGHGNMGHGNMGPGNMGPGNMGPGNMGPGNMGPGNMGPGNMGPGNMGPGNMGPGNMGPGNMGPGNMGPGNMGPGNMGPGNMGHGNMGHGNMGPGNMGPGNMGPGNMGPGNMGPGNMGPGNIGPGNMGHGNMGHGNMGPGYITLRFMGGSFDFGRSGNYNQTNFFNPFMNNESYQQSNNHRFPNQSFTNPSQSQYNAPYGFPSNFRPFFSNNEK